MICGVCRGSGTLMGYLLQFWACPGCGGDGVAVQHGPKTFAEARKRLSQQERK